METCFEDGPWLDIFEYLNVPIVRGTLYGGIKISGLENTIAHILGDSRAKSKISQLMVLIKSAQSVDEEIVARFHDPTGEMDGYFHKSLVEQLGPALTKGAGLLLCNVSVLSTCPMTNFGTNRVNSVSSPCYLNIVPANVERVFVCPSSIDKEEIASVLELVWAFHDASVGKNLETDQAESDEAESQMCDAIVRDMPIDPDMLESTVKEMTFQSQRQVIQPNCPASRKSVVREPMKTQSLSILSSQFKSSQQLAYGESAFMDAERSSMDSVSFITESPKEEMVQSSQRIQQIGSLDAKGTGEDSETKCPNVEGSQALQLLSSQLDDDSW